MNGLYKTQKKKEAPPRNHFVDAVVRFFASGFYAGYVPVIPGTTGAALGVLVYMTILLRMDLKPILLFFVYLGFYLVGAFISTLALDVYTEADYNVIVIDKMLGAMIAVSGFSSAVWQHALPRVFVAFMVYRLWEIAKLFPLRPLEKLPKGLGVMADDVAGGIIALLIGIYMPDRIWDTFGWTLPVVKR